MCNTTLAEFYRRDLNKLAEELSLFHHDENIWKTTGTISNSSGNLSLHLIGGLNYLVGTQLAATGYVRNRAAEFSTKNIPRKDLIENILQVKDTVFRTINTMTPEQWNADYPIPFDDDTRTVQYVLVQLLAHLNYHLGQINYLRRMLDQ